MIFGLFKSKKDNNLKDLTGNFNKLEQRVDLNVDYYRELKNDFEKLKNETQASLRHTNMINQTLNLRVSGMEQILSKKLIEENEKQVFTDKKINTTTAILNLLKDSKMPLDFNSIKDKIKEYDLKSIDVSDKSIKQSIYNLVYAKKISRSKKNGKGIYQIRASTTKQ